MIPSAAERNMQQEMIPYMWTENESIDEIRQRLLCTNFELITARMQANTEIRKYEDTITRLFHMLKRVCQERDEARDQLQQLKRNSQPSTKAETTRSTSTSQLQSQRQVPHKFKPLSVTTSTKESDKSSKSKASSHHSYDLSLANSQTKDGHSSMGFSHTRIAESTNFSLAKQATHQNRTSTVKADVGFSRDIGVDSASVVIDKLTWGKPLPQKGRLLHSVTEAGPLLQTLLVAPLPRWQNPPPMSSPCISDSAANVDDKASVIANGAIPTSLSLAFPGNSRPASQMSSASSSGISVKNEPLPYLDMDSNMMHNQLSARKKRKLL